MSTLPAPDEQSFGPLVTLLVAVGMLGSIATHLIVPSLPDLQREFDTDYSTVQLLVSLFIVAYGVTQILAGPLADAFGRRRMLLLGLLIFTIASALCAIAARIEALLALRVVQGASACFGIVLARAIVRDVSTDATTATMLGYLAVGTSVGAMLSPLLGGLLYEGFGWAGPFWFMTAFSGIGLVLVYAVVKETAPSAAGWLTLRRMPQDFAALLRRGSFMIHASNICLNTAIFYSFIIGAALIASRDLGLTPTQYGLWFFIIALGYAAGNFLSGRIGLRLSSRWAVLLGSVLVSLCIMVMNILHLNGYISAVALFVPMAGATLASGFVMPNSLAGGLSVDASKAGSAAGLLGFMQFAAAAIFSYIAGHMVGESAQSLLVMMFAIALTGTLSAALLFLLSQRV